MERRRKGGKEEGGREKGREEGWKGEGEGGREKGRKGQDRLRHLHFISPGLQS